MGLHRTWSWKVRMICLQETCSSSSDTLVFADDMLPRWGVLNRTWDKYCVLTWAWDFHLIFFINIRRKIYFPHWLEDCYCVVPASNVPPFTTLTKAIPTSGPLVAYTCLHTVSAPCWTALQLTLWKLLPKLSMRAQCRRPWQGSTTRRLWLLPDIWAPIYAGQRLQPRCGLHSPTSHFPIYIATLSQRRSVTVTCNSSFFNFSCNLSLHGLAIHIQILMLTLNPDLSWG